MAKLVPVHSLWRLTLRATRGLGPLRDQLPDDVVLCHGLRLQERQD
jgi:hypothetical protein